MIKIPTKFIARNFNLQGVCVDPTLIFDATSDDGRQYARIYVAQTPKGYYVFGQQIRGLDFGFGYLPSENENENTPPAKNINEAYLTLLKTTFKRINNEFCACTIDFKVKEAIRLEIIAISQLSLF